MNWGKRMQAHFDSNGRIHEKFEFKYMKEYPRTELIGIPISNKIMFRFEFNLSST